MNKQEMIKLIRENGFNEDIATRIAEIDRKIILSIEYLVSTDWYYARKLETSEEVPEDVAIKRTEAREFIRSQGDATV